MEYIKRLEKTIEELENNSGKLANLPELVKSIKELVGLYSEASESVEKSKVSLAEIEGQLKDKLEGLQKALELEQEAKDELLNNVRSVLTANNKEQLDAVNSITSVVSNKVAIAESNLTVKTTEINNEAKLINTKIEGLGKDVTDVSSKICEYGDKATRDLDELKFMIPIIKRTQIFSIVAAALALIACVLSIVM